MGAASLAERLSALDWQRIEEDLWEWGFARTDRVLDPRTCARLRGVYGDDDRFRTRVSMARHRFGEGDYAYFAHPLPEDVSTLRRELYRHLAPLANRAMRSLGRELRYPATLAGFLTQCREAGQEKPTPLLLRYRAGGYNCLHQDLYGSVAFPLQVAINLSRPQRDYEGGEFLLVEQRPRAQSRGCAVAAGQGELIIFPSAERPAQGKRGVVRFVMRHGASRVVRGERYVLGLIFHDAR